MKKLIAAILFLTMFFSVAPAEESLPDLSNISVGDIITFGRYEQDNNPDNGPEPIEWIVLDVQDGKALLLSKYGLDAKPYHTERAEITWEECTLRAWLNNEFLNTAFSAEEQSAILVTEVDNSASQCYSDYSSSGGNNTRDNVFLLSYAEAKKYFEVQYWEIKGADQNVKSRVVPTDYAKKTGARTKYITPTADDKPVGQWWLRSPGIFQSRAALVDYGGSLYNSRVDSGGGCVRPAFWLNLESGIF